MKARALLVAGTSSGAGKSTLTLALCRILARRGIDVAPFKAQNMSLNSCVTPEGGEIARAQMLQALACGLAPVADMNPILLKPEGNGKSHVVLLGRAVGSRGPAGPAQVAENRRIVAAAFDRLATRHQVVVIEGAGGAAEINLAGRDLANLELARRIRAPAILVGDIDRGGVFAALYGTWALLPRAEQRLVRGFVINRMRDALASLGDGPGRLARLTGVPVIGGLPHRPDLHAALDPEDGLDLAALPRSFAGRSQDLRIALVGLPRVANASDIQPLKLAPGVDFALAVSPGALRDAHVILLPGSKKTVEDLDWLRRSGLSAAIRARVRQGGILVGLCGGFQMMGRRIEDPDRVESARRSAAGLGFFPVRTVFTRERRITPVSARCALPFHAGEVSAYEIHYGRSEGALPGRPAFHLPNGKPDGAWAGRGRVWGTYLHGLFENDRFRNDFLAWTRRLFRLPARPGFDYRRARLAAIDRWTDVVERSADWRAFLAREGIPFSPVNRCAAATRRRARSGQA